jgi:hypothetical protein
VTQFPAVAFFPKAVLASARPCTRKRFEEAYLSSRSPIKKSGVAQDFIWEKKKGGGRWGMAEIFSYCLYCIKILEYYFGDGILV